MRVDDLVRFIQRRTYHMQVREGLRKPGGKDWDPIIAEYRFCNVRRNDDRVTKFVFEWADRWNIDKHWDLLWFVFAAARLFNHPGTLNDIADFVVPFNPNKMLKALADRERKGKRVFNAAYIVSTNGRAMPKPLYVVEHLLVPLWDDRKRITKMVKDANSLDELHQIMMGQNGFASFMAAQVVADLKYFGYEDMPDFHTFAASGPGSKRGLNRVMGAGLKATWAESMFREQLNLLRDKVNAKLRWPEPLTAQDIQNCLCEFDKYERARLGEGRPKQKYVPHKEK